MFLNGLRTAFLWFVESVIIHELSVYGINSLVRCHLPGYAEIHWTRICRNHPSVVHVSALALQCTEKLVPTALVVPFHHMDLDKFARSKTCNNKAVSWTCAHVLPCALSYTTHPPKHSSTPRIANGQSPP